MTIWHRLQNSVSGRYKEWMFRPYTIERSVAGEHINVFIGDRFGEGWYGPQHEPWPELDWIKTYGIRKGDVVVDCGANHGFTSVLFSKWTGPRGKVLAFEPLPHNVNVLRENVKLNEIQNVTVYPLAVGDSRGTVRISTHPNASVLTKGMNEGRTLEVPTRTLDEETTGLSVDFLKVDVEGFELEVLKGAKRILSEKPRLALELHIFSFEDKVNHLNEIFGCLPLSQYQVEIQYHVDGPIRPLDPAVDKPEFLANFDVVHIYCR